MLRKPTTGRDDKNNVEMRMICSDVSIAGNFEHAEPAGQAETLKVSALRKTIPRGRHVNKARCQRINRNIAHGKRQKNKPASGILRFDPLEALIILPKELNGPPPLTSGAKSIAAKVGGSDQSVIRQANRCTAIPNF